MVMYSFSQCGLLARKYIQTDKKTQGKCQKLSKPVKIDLALGTFYTVLEDAQT